MKGPQWDAEADVVVIGFGGAGASAAIEAADQGADVLVLDRFSGGGATQESGGVVYAGGGTPQQRQAGMADSPEAMFAYLRKETAGVVSDAVLRRFCDESAAHLAWLESLGVSFDGSLSPFKTSYPTNDYFLYYSGNEQFPPYSDAAEPAPRGHRAVADGLDSGKKLFGALARAAHDRGIRLRTQARAQRLIIEEGRVIGVEYAALPPGRAARVHKAASARLAKLNNYFPPGAAPLNRLVERLEARHAKTYRVRARKGVIVAAGGFVYNGQMLAEHAPAYLEGQPLGTIGDDGSGIRLGVEAGGATGHLDRVSVWRFYTPPASLARGVLVNREGERICNELLYGATIGSEIVTSHNGHAYLVIDKALVDTAWKEMRSQTVFFQRAQMSYLLTIGHKKARTIEALARKTGIDPAGLRATVETYNSLGTDPLGKPDAYLHQLGQGSYYAFDVSLRSPLFFPSPMITLGGLTVHDDTGSVLTEGGAAIEGLYAAGRSAVGVASHSYVSGLSIADCIFSGRRAGAAAAAA
ncbi:FAD-binding protein [Streptomyces sp. NPDC088182]|uniref:FAD-binding protein n=1 Tax=Streptomyces sp. NPDC088182 TaxID=3365838 RepID=UPI00380342A9